MIREIYSTLPAFKTVKLNPGFNLLVSDKSKANEDRPSRNHAGKTSVIEIIHFLLGASVRHEYPFRAQELKGQTFGMRATLGGHEVRVERDVAGDSGLIRLYEESLSGADLLGHQEPVEMSVQDWCKKLGEWCFDIRNTESFGPSFRPLFSYFVRRFIDGGFQKAQASSSHLQSEGWQMQVNLAYLLGMDWRLFAQLEKLRQQGKEYKQLARSLKSDGVMGDAFGEASQLSAKLAVAKDKVKRLERDLAAFRVLDQYADVEREASALASKIAENANLNTLDRELIRELEAALAEEQIPDEQSIERVYEAALIDLPGIVREHLARVQSFHHAVVNNRREHLNGEIRGAEKRIEQREAESAQIQPRLQELMQLLKTHGALDAYNLIARELGNYHSEAASLGKRLEIANQIEDGGKELKVRLAEVDQQMAQDRREREEILNDAAVLFNQMSQILCDKASILQINPTQKGLGIRFSGGPDERRGIPNLEMLCFDLTLMQLAMERGMMPPLLAHDSPLFDPLEERQITNALNLARKLAEDEENGFQYLATMNTDRLSDAETRHPELLKHIIEPRLTDEQNHGGLFGCILTYPPNEKGEGKKGRRRKR